MFQKLICFIILGLLIFAPIALFAKPAPIGSDGTTAKANILLLLDTSYSMNRTTGQITDNPRNVEFNSQDHAYIAQNDGVIHVYDASGTFTHYIGGENQTDFNESDRLTRAVDIAFDSNDRLYVADKDRGRLQRFTADGNLDTYVNIVNIRAVDIDSNNNVYVINNNRSVDVYDSNLNFIHSWPNHIPQATYIAIDSNDHIYLTHRHDQHRFVGKYNSQGLLLNSIPTVKRNGTAYKAIGIEIADNGDIFVGSIDTDRIYQYRNNGSYVTRYNVGLTNPYALSKDNNGNIWVADAGNDRVINLSDNAVIPITLRRIDRAANALRAVVSNSELTSSANFGLITWDATARLTVPVGETGANQIIDFLNNDIDLHFATDVAAAMDLASDYLNDDPNSPLVPDAACQQTIIIVITDGRWVRQHVAREVVAAEAEATATDLLNTHNIKTYVLGTFIDDPIATNFYNQLSLAGGTQDVSPILATNEANIVSAVNSFVQQAINASLSFSAPTIVPSTQGSDHLIQSVFHYQDNHQWKGHLKKYALDEQGLLGDLQWDAGELLNTTAADNRKLWTAHNGLMADATLNNFTTANTSLLKGLLGERHTGTLSDDTANNIIRFIRGKDIYNEYPTGIDSQGTTLMPSERWKLADIYHSRAVVVGPPKAGANSSADIHSEEFYRFSHNYHHFQQSGICGTPTCLERRSVVYVGSNGGMLHAFDFDTGQELWGFIPPSVIPNFPGVISSINASSNSIFGVDGPITVKDIFYDGQWRTILMGGLRQGGHSYYALDVTNPLAPQHLFTFSREINHIAYWNDQGERQVYHLNQDDITLDASMDFRSLGQAWSTPVIVNIPIDENTNKWVALIGSGFHTNINQSFGARIYAIDLENNGAILQNIILGDTIANNGITNASASTMSVITADSTANFNQYGALVYMTDLEGILWKINFTNSGTLYEKTRVFSSQSTHDNGRYTFHQTASALDHSGTLYQFFGSGDLMNLNAKRTSLQNRVIALKDTDFPGYTPLDTAYSPSNLQDITPFMHYNSDEQSSSCVTSDFTQGWYLNLGANEKVTSKLTIWNGDIIVPRYTPSSSNDICNVGTASITEHYFECGQIHKTTSLGKGIPTEVVVYKGKIYMGISTDDSSITLPSNYVKQGNLIVGTPRSIENPLVSVESWYEHHQ